VYSEHIHTQDKPTEVLEIYRQLDQFCFALSPSTVGKRYLAKYVAYRNGKRTFCTAHLQKGGMRIWLKLDYHSISNPRSFARNVRGVGHWGLGDLELRIATSEQLIEALPLIRRSFQED
jgi:predicted transport protein